MARLIGTNLNSTHFDFLGGIKLIQKICNKVLLRFGVNVSVGPANFSMIDNTLNMVESEPFSFVGFGVLFL